MGAWRPKHVEWLCRNKTCTVLHQVGVSFDFDSLSCSCRNQLCADLYHIQGVASLTLCPRPSREAGGLIIRLVVTKTALLLRELLRETSDVFVPIATSCLRISGWPDPCTRTHYRSVRFVFPSCLVRHFTKEVLVCSSSNKVLTALFQTAHRVLLTLWRLMTLIVVVPHR